MSIGTDKINEWLYVSRRLHRLCVRDDAPGWRVATFWSADDQGLPLLFYRLTPAVYVWFERALAGLGIKVAAEVMAEWREIREWASRHLDVSEIAKARDLPKVDLPQPEISREEMASIDRWVERAEKATAESKADIAAWLSRFANKKRFEEGKS